jgi:hypothetical protein
MINKEKSVYTVHGPCLYTHVHTARALERGFGRRIMVHGQKVVNKGVGRAHQRNPRRKKGARRTIKLFSKHLSGVRMVKRLLQGM